MFRFGNVVGPRQTHGVGFDFVRRLLKDPTVLTILGDGSQSKSYIDVGDVVSAVLTAHRRTERALPGLQRGDGRLHHRHRDRRARRRVLGLDPAAVRFEYTGGDRGWKGDVPIVRLNTDRIRALGWAPSGGCAWALSEAMRALSRDERAGLL